MAETLVSALIDRLHAVLDREPVTEAELRKLSKEAQACADTLGTRLEQGQRRLAELASDPSSSLAEIAASLRTVHELRPDLNDLQTLLSELQRRARELRAAWLSTP